MLDRSWLRDAALAVMLAVPTAALAAAGQSQLAHGTSLGAAHGDHSSAVENRFSLFAPS
jgi:hypothetical protein